MKLETNFYTSGSVTSIAKQILGSILYTDIGGKLTSGLIVETEAYSYKEKGCHAYNYKKTKRTTSMFLEGGVAYVYVCYGIHHMFNVVTNVENEPEAVLIRGIEPIDGIAIMKTRRRNIVNEETSLTSGPGKLTQALGIRIQQDGISLLSNTVWIEKGKQISKEKIISTPRIGIDYADEDAKLLWRYNIKDNNFVSK